MAGVQAALRRAAMLVARGASQDEVFTAIAEEAGRLLAVAATGLFRFEPDESVTLVGGWARFSEVVQIGLRLPPDSANFASQVARTRKFARLCPKWTGSTGLTGLSDRAAALGGSLRIESPDGGGTALIAQLPLMV